MPQPRKYQSAAQRQAAYRHRNEQATRNLLATRGLPPMPALPAIPGTVRWNAIIGQIKQLAGTARTEMEHYAEQRSEAWNDSERAEQHQDKQNILDDLIELIENWN